MLQKSRMYLTVALVLLTVSFIVQNMVQVELRFLFWSFSTSRVVMVLILLAVGFALGVITSSLVRHKYPH